MIQGFFRLFIAPIFPQDKLDTGLFEIGIIDGAHATYGSSNYDGVYLSFFSRQHLGRVYLLHFVLVQPNHVTIQAG